MISIAHDLTDLAVDELRDDELVDAFLANMRKVEEIRRTAAPYVEACEQIIERLGRGDLAGECADCGRPLFDRDDKRTFTKEGTIVCAPACPARAAAPAPMILGVDHADGPDVHVERLAVVANGNVTLFSHRFARVRRK